eukprot:6832180-Ditylum_brightwellii.AAC.1
MVWRPIPPKYVGAVMTALGNPELKPSFLATLGRTMSSRDRHCFVVRHVAASEYFMLGRYT